MQRRCSTVGCTHYSPTHSTFSLVPHLCHYINLVPAAAPVSRHSPPPSHASSLSQHALPSIVPRRSDKSSCHHGTTLVEPKTACTVSLAASSAACQLASSSAVDAHPPSLYGLWRSRAQLSACIWPITPHVGWVTLQTDPLSSGDRIGKVFLVKS